MREITSGNVSPQMKQVFVNNKFGNTGIKRQQGSTVIKYDTLPLDGRTEFRFFEGCQSRVFPFTNSNSEGNKLGVGNSMTIERMYLSIVTTDALAPNLPTAIASFDLTTNIAVLTSEFSFLLANATVIKNVPILSFVPNFNKLAENNLNSSFEFDTQIVVPPLLDFIASLRTQAYTAVENTSIRLTLEGAGAIIAPKQPSNIN
jgi:hypothetical protein